MLTLKFESDTRSSDSGDLALLTEAKSFRTRGHRDGTVDVLLENEHGVEIAHPVGGSLGTFDRCYVMNSAGQTVARIVPESPNRPVSE